MNKDEIYVCRCEEVTVADIERAIAEGADSIRAIKVRTNAGMGVCQGMTCRRNIERMLREKKVDLDVCKTHQRFPVRSVEIDALLTAREEDDESCR